MADAPISKRSNRPLSAAQSLGVAQKTLESGLYLVSTPIGNADDITLRALRIFREAEALACEDTRMLRKLLDIHGIDLGDRPLIAYHDHNAAEARPRLLRLLEEGAAVAYSSDAGTPLVADPGYRLAQEAQAAGVLVQAAPGACAPITALTLAGLPSDKFCFGGFLPAKSAARRKALQEWRGAPGTLVFFESPRRIAECLADMLRELGPREAVVARELTKKFQQIRKGALEELAQTYAAEDAPKGEVVILLGPRAAAKASDAEIDAALQDALTRLSVKDAAREVADVYGGARKELYKRALTIRRDARADET